MLSIVVSWRDRAELAVALPGLVACAEAAGGDLTVVNFDGDPEALEAQLADHRQAVRVLWASDQPYFNKSKAQNLGIAHTRQPFLFFCDCDILIEPTTVLSLLDQVRTQEGTFATLAGVTESEQNARGAGHVTCFGYTLLIRTADGGELRIVDSEEDAEDGTRNAPGLLLARRRDLLAIGGFNSHLHGWGWEDQDLIARLTLAARLRRITDGRAVHISHDDAARVAHYPVANRWESRDRMFRQALANYDQADFSGTLAEDRLIPVTVPGPGGEEAARQAVIRPSAAPVPSSTDAGSR